MAGGRIDGAVFVIGIMLGSALFSETFSLVEPIYKAGAMGRVFLNTVFGLPLGVTLFLVTVVGILFIVFFVFLEKFVRNMTGRSS